MNIWDILSMMGSLALILLVLALTYFGTRWYAKRMGAAGGAGKHIKILDKAALGAGTALVIAQVGDRFYLLGIGDKNVHLVAELPGFEEELLANPAQAQTSFSQVFQQFMDKSRGMLNNKDNGDHP